MRGSTTLEGGERGSNGRLVPVTVKLFSPGSFTWQNRNNPDYRYDLITSDSGNRTPENNWLVDFRPWENMPAGEWDATIESPHTLMNIYHGVNLAGPYTDVNFGTLLEGNCNNDQQINVLDFSTLASSYLKSSGQPGFSPTADFDRNGWVNALDFSLLAKNYLRSSPIDVTPGDGAGMGGEGLSPVYATTCASTYGDHEGFTYQSGLFVRLTSPEPSAFIA